MKNLFYLILLVFLIAWFFSSCSPDVSMYQAANRSYKGTRSVR